SLSRPAHARRRVAPVQDEDVAVRVVEERHQADACVDRLAQELDALPLEDRPRLGDVRHPQGDAGGVRLEPHSFRLGLPEPEAEGVRFESNTAGVALRVPDVAEARAILEREGVEFLGETVDTGVCLMAFFYDPDGNVLILHRRYAPAGVRGSGEG